MKRITSCIANEDFEPLVGVGVWVVRGVYLRFAACAGVANQQRLGRFRYQGKQSVAGAPRDPVDNSVPLAVTDELWPDRRWKARSRLSQLEHHAQGAESQSAVDETK